MPITVDSVTDPMQTVQVPTKSRDNFDIEEVEGLASKYYESKSKRKQPE